MRNYRCPLSASLSLILTITLAGFAVSTAAKSAAQTESVLYGFPGTSVGTTPNAGVVFDSSGNLYSTTYLGGPKNFGSVFELMPVSGGWQGSALHTFQDKTDGGNPTSNLILDDRGNLYGTSDFGGNTLSAACYPYGCGVVFEFSPVVDGGWKETVIHAFQNGSDGADPATGVVMDAAGNLYGSTPAGGPNGKGIVYKLSRTSGSWRETILHSFTGGEDGNAPFGGVILDSGGNLYGTAAYGGNASDCTEKNQGGCGVVFKLSPSSGGGWNEEVLHAFSGADGAFPFVSLVFDSAGNLYGATNAGGNLNACASITGFGCGAIFKLSPGAGGGWREAVLHVFSGSSDGALPSGPPVLDASGNLYGTTSAGANFNCNNGCGVVFKLAPASSGSWHETILYSFSGFSDGGVPVGGVTLDAFGNLYGTTADGGPDGNGTVFEINP